MSTTRQTQRLQLKRKTYSFLGKAAELSLRQFPRYKHLRPWYANRMFRKFMQMAVSKFLMSLFKCRISVFLHSIWDYMEGFIFFRKKQRRTFRMIRRHWKRIFFSSGVWLMWLFVRSLIITFQIFGTAKFFSKAVALLIKQNKKHFPLGRFIYLILFSYTQTGRKKNTIPSILLIVDGKFNGNMRTTKYMIRIGTPRIYEIDTFYDFSMQTSYSLYGNMGIRFWVLYTLPYKTKSSIKSKTKYINK